MCVPVNSENKRRGHSYSRTRRRACERDGQKVALILTTEERQRLESCAHRSRSAAALARRARIILGCAERTGSKVVARRLHVTPGTVCKWRGRFIVNRLDGALR